MTHPEQPAQDAEDSRSPTPLSDSDAEKVVGGTGGGQNSGDPMPGAVPPPESGS